MRSGRSQKPTSAPDQRFRARFRVADHHSARHRRARQNGVKKAVHLRVVNQQPEKQNQVGVAVENRIQKSAENSYAALPPRHRPIQNIKKSREHHHTACRRKSPGRK